METLPCHTQLNLAMLIPAYIDNNLPTIVGEFCSFVREISGDLFSDYWWES